jgi:signal transduction histidine kinase
MYSREASGAPAPIDSVAAASPRSAEGSASEIVLLDERGVILAVNEAWRASVDQRGLNLHRYGVGDSYVDLACQFLPDLDRAGLEDSLRKVSNGETEHVLHAYAVETARGPRWRQLQIRPLKLDDGVRFVAIHEDLTELVRAQEALRRTSEQLLSVQEEERQRIAIELHDSTSQHLAVLGLGLARLRRLQGDAARDGVLDDMDTALREAVKETRVLSYLLKPNGLLQEGLATTARRFVEGFAARTGLAISFAATGDHRGLSAPVEHAAFRIVQEALSNVYRHADAKRAAVELDVADGLLTVRVADNGRGLRTNIGQGGEGPPLGVGIAGMQVRVEQLDGALEIRGGRCGTCVEATIPVAGR